MFIYFTTVSHLLTMSGLVRLTLETEANKLPSGHDLIPYSFYLDCNHDPRRVHSKAKSISWILHKTPSSKVTLACSHLAIKDEVRSVGVRKEL
jgi:hypothetical protein